MCNRKDYRTFLGLVLWALIPSVYLLVRMNIVAINGVDINILGQMEWFDLIDETIVTALTVPLYYLLKPGKSDSKKNGMALLVSFAFYALLTIAMSLVIGNISAFMHAEHATQYLLLQSFSLLIGFISTFVIILLTLHADYKTIGLMVLIRLGTLVLADWIFIRAFGDLGAAYSEIIVNSIIAIVMLCISKHRQYLSAGKVEKDFFVQWAKKGAFVAIQIFLDNFIYAIMICRMVNAVQESGNYWVANNFIWGWLLVPVTCMTEIIKKNNLDALTMKNTWRFGIGIATIWVCTIPLWQWFIAGPMAADTTAILPILYLTMPFYLAYIPSAFIDGWFVSRGKTIYLAIISAFCNLVYYGIVYLLFANGVFQQNIQFVILMFGIGLLVHLGVSLCFYFIERHRICYKTHERAAC